MIRFLTVAFLLSALFLGTSCVPESNLVIACYSIPKDTLEVGQNIQFTNCSFKADYYLWDFGDSTYSEEANPVHQYTEEKRFTVKLKAFREFNADSINTQIIVFEAPTGVEK